MSGDGVASWPKAGIAARTATRAQIKRRIGGDFIATPCCKKSVALILVYLANEGKSYIIKGVIYKQ
jgi:hypothetical protein